MYGPEVDVFSNFVSLWYAFPKGGGYRSRSVVTSAPRLLDSPTVAIPSFPSLSSKHTNTAISLRNTWKKNINRQLVHCVVGHCVPPWFSVLRACAVVGKNRCTD